MADASRPLPTYVREARRVVEQLRSTPGFNATEALVTSVAMVQQLHAQIVQYERGGRSTPAAAPKTHKNTSV